MAVFFGTRNGDSGFGDEEIIIGLLERKPWVTPVQSTLSHFLYKCHRSHLLSPTHTS